MTISISAPSGCRHCEVEAREHRQRWTAGVGLHRWVEPTQEQRKTRMFAHCEAAQTQHSGEVS